MIINSYKQYHKDSVQAALVDKPHPQISSLILRKKKKTCGKLHWLNVFCENFDHFIRLKLIQLGCSDTQDEPGSTVNDEMKTHQSLRSQVRLFIKYINIISVIFDMLSHLYEHFLSVKRKNALKMWSIKILLLICTITYCQRSCESESNGLLKPHP